MSVWSSARTPQAAVADLVAHVDAALYGQMLAFFPPSMDAEALGREFAAAFPGLPVAGCSTAGEITPDGIAADTVVVLALPRCGFRVVTDVIPDVRALTVESGAATARRLRAALERLCGERPDAAGHRFGLILIDGMSYREETCVSAVAMALDGIPIVGGSAGDGLSFGTTAQLHNGAAFRNAAVLMLVETDHPVEVFRNDNFSPTDRKLVVTRCDPERRIVHELNAEPAAQAYAAAVGVGTGDLNPMRFASHPVVVRIGGNYYCRSIQRVNPDDSLSFFCAIDDGVVLTVARPRDLVSSAEAELSRLDQALGGLDLVIGFDCVLRRLDAARRRIRPRVEELYRRHNVTGFFTYGEQFGGMHLNQTFSGVAIGRPRTH
ncbi:FIST N-terminal domain-containing protein [Paracraurococcus ruber]|uniref:FIST N-terminal domain-containing protein n=1 Tax=Paracraurococcus ruber TaxID=77675 RepID=UPI001908C90C|nr:FIST N-terminal domain-containing protein [Paracraurococcus ruber]